ncbi:hypothetical protein [Acaryochloris sp. IP29b_bin.137]|uniref:hypothetical protein n=1 Tax=Acaryochloris sp. IP29b_bin.137 TaxID=2969217 RepID=UPI002602F35A|nr:hypothetical protein [Acaryochloris sp. IP29b_bin.137]
MTYVHNPPDPNRQSESAPLPSREALLASAREAYDAYCQIHTDLQPPTGVAMDRNTGRGQLIFSEQPILLPHECFIAADQIQIEDVPQPEEIEFN